MTEHQIRQIVKEELRALLSDVFKFEVPAATQEPVTVEETTNVTTSRVSATLNQIGVPAHVKGYRFLREAITEVSRDESMLDSMANLYKLVAERYGTTGSRAERAMRHAVEVAFDSGGITHLFKEKPTNGHFIGLMSEKFRQEGVEHSYGKHDRQ